MNTFHNKRKKGASKFEEKHYGKPNIGGDWELTDKQGNKFSSKDL